KTSDHFLKAKGKLGKYEIKVTDRLIDFVRDYKYIPSENARPINGRLENFIFEQIYDGILLKKIKPLGALQHIEADLKEYSNGVKSVIFKITVEDTGEVYSFHRIIKETIKDKVIKPLSYERVKEISKMREEILSNVFGVEHIV